MFRKTTLLAAACSVIAITANATVISDTEFLGANWSHVELREDSASIGTPTQEISGGNAGAYRENVFTTLTAGGTKRLHEFNGYTPTTYDPSVAGSIMSLDFEADLAIIARNNVFNAVEILLFAGLQQDGVVYRSTVPYFQVAPDNSGDGVWQSPAAATGLIASDFDTYSNDTTGAPDFSATGGAITFGYIAQYATSASNASITFGVDNFSVEITPVPEPGSLALMGLGGLCMFKRRRRS